MKISGDQSKILQVMLSKRLKDASEIISGLKDKLEKMDNINSNKASSKSGTLCKYQSYNYYIQGKAKKLRPHHRKFS